MVDQIRHIVFVNAHFCPFLAIFALPIPHFSPLFAIFDVTEPPDISNHPPSFLRMRVQAPLRPSEGPPLQKACRSELCHGLAPFMPPNGQKLSLFGAFRVKTEIGTPAEV